MVLVLAATLGAWLLAAVVVSLGLCRAVRASNRSDLPVPPLALPAAPARAAGTPVRARAGGPSRRHPVAA